MPRLLKINNPFKGLFRTDWELKWGTAITTNDFLPAYQQENPNPWRSICLRNQYGLRYSLSAVRASLFDCGSTPSTAENKNKAIEHTKRTVYPNGKVHVARSHI